MFSYVDNHLISSTDDESDTASVTNHAVTQRRRQPVRHPISVSQENLAGSGSRRKGGVRRTRRIDNCNYFLYLSYLMIIN